jgi:hypothetical protein
VIYIVWFHFDKDLNKHRHNRIYKMVLFGCLAMSCKYLIGTSALIYNWFDCVCRIEGFIYYYIYLIHLFWKAIWIVDLFLMLNQRLSGATTKRIIIYALFGYTLPSLFALLLLFISPLFPQLMDRVINISFFIN